MGVTRWGYSKLNSRYFEWINYNPERELVKFKTNATFFLKYKNVEIEGDD